MARSLDAEDIVIPVYLPTSNGVGELEIGTGHLRDGVLTVEFRNTVPGVAIQRMIARGEILGLSVFKVEPDDTKDVEPTTEEDASLGETSE